MKLQDFMSLSDLQEDFSEVETILSNNPIIPKELTFLEVPETEKFPHVLNTLIEHKVIKSNGVIMSITESENVSWPEKLMIRNSEDDLFYVGISKGSSQFFIAINSDIYFYLYL